MDDILKKLMEKQEESDKYFPNSKAIINEKRVLEDIEFTIIGMIKSAYNLSTKSEALENWERFKNDKLRSVV